jgi:uncharacterized protein
MRGMGRLGKRVRCVGLAALAALSGCSVERIYYYPNAVLYADPANAGLAYEVVNYPSLNGKRLSGIHFETDQAPKGIVVHFHGNFGNVSNHFPASVFLLKEGFDLLVFDYQGFGGSEGRPSPQATVEDGIASVRYAYNRRRAKDSGVGVFGQSIGAAVAAVVAGEEPLVKAAVLEAGFTTYRAITKDVMKRSFLTWPFAFVFPPLAVRRRYDPVDSMARISPRPVFLLHGNRDRTIPVRMSRELFQKAREPKTLWIVEGADHLACRRAAGQTYDKRISEFFERNLKTIDKGSD